MLRLALAALLSLAVLAPAGHASESLQETVTAATRQAERAAQKAAKHEALEAELKAARQARETEHAAIRQARHEHRAAIRLAQKQKEGNEVEIGCEGVTVKYANFNAVEGSPNQVVEYVTIKNPPASAGPGPITFPAIPFEFEGSEAASTIPIAFPVGEHYLVDVHAKWDTNGKKGNFDIHGQISCGPKPAFTIQKLQSIGGSGKPFTTETLTANEGETVDYEVLVTNTGNTPLTFGELTDEFCGSISHDGELGVPLEPRETITFFCTHTLGAKEAEAGFYRNVASITGTPEEGEGKAIEHESNTVEVDPIVPKKEEGGEEPKNGGGEPEHKTTTTTPEHEVLGNKTSTPPASSGGESSKFGVLGFTSATVPALHGPEGCVRASDFTVSVKSAGVASVTFYLDGHKLRSLSAKAARKGLISIRISAAKLRVGVHKVTAKITMKPVTGSSKAAKATRALMILRCKSAVLTPRFTG